MTVGESLSFPEVAADNISQHTSLSWKRREERGPTGFVNHEMLLVGEELLSPEQQLLL